MPRIRRARIVRLPPFFIRPTLHAPSLLMRFTLTRLFAAPVLVLAGACIPYATGTTAATVPQGTVIPAMAVYFVPGGIETLNGDSLGNSSLIGFDFEARMGIDDRSDLGIRAPGAAGVVLDYKRRVTGLA
ncbi:hypothetical protein, partial [Longimicrobium sp.]|uniref:hypothetical protein n=1 Tax=Longimicrobium sp. TaxID=2029185 RepID=UPI002E369939